MKLERDYLDIIVAVRLLGGRERGCVKKDGPGNEVEALRVRHSSCLIPLSIVLEGHLYVCI